MSGFRTETVLERLRERGYRLTRPREAVIRVLDAAEGWLSPLEIQQRGRRHCPTLGLVTVYRTLDLLSTLGYAGRIHLEHRCQGYARTEPAHSHHLVCRGCQQVVEFPGSEDLTPLIDQIATRTGFRIEDHLLELLGWCPACQAAPG